MKITSGKIILANLLKSYLNLFRKKEEKKKRELLLILIFSENY